MAKQATPKAPKSTEVTLGNAGKFAFTMRTNVSIPENTRTGGSTANPLPFKAWMDKMVHNGVQFIPEAFWTAKPEEGGRGAVLTKMKPSVAAYQKSKIRDAFNAWKSPKVAESATAQVKAEAEALAKSRAKHSCVLVYRTKGDTDASGYVYEENGVDFFMQIEK